MGKSNIPDVTKLFGQLTKVTDGYWMRAFNEHWIYVGIIVVIAIIVIVIVK